MTVSLVCLLMRHKWTPAEASNEPGLRLVCKRCGREKSLDGGTDVHEKAMRDATLFDARRE